MAPWASTQSPWWWFQELPRKQKSSWTQLGVIILRGQIGPGTSHSWSVKCKVIHGWFLFLGAAQNVEESPGLELTRPSWTLGSTQLWLTFEQIHHLPHVQLEGPSAGYDADSGAVSFSDLPNINELVTEWGFLILAPGPEPRILWKHDEGWRIFPGKW